nr:hypothetical protein [Tanacetum cinerariifolium]
FDNNPHGIKFKHFTAFTARNFTEIELCDVIGTVMSDAIPFKNFKKDQLRRTIILEDVQSQIHLSLEAQRVIEPETEFKSSYCCRSTLSRTDLRKEASTEKDPNLEATIDSLSFSKSNKRGNLTRNVIGTVMSDAIPFKSFRKDQLRRTIILEDVQ